jgi:ABC-type transporter Mla maintaining outer membrane lipid asymmetry ATPase subunit MlaF
MTLRVARSTKTKAGKKTQAQEVLEQTDNLSPMIETRGIVKTFKNAAGEFTVLKGIDLTIGRGEFVSIVGKSGSGKSTLLNMITGIDHPTAGQMIVGGTDIYHNMGESQRSRWRGRNLGIVFQFFQLLPMLTLLENVMLPMDYADLYDFDARPQRAKEMLALVGLEKYRQASNKPQPSRVPLPVIRLCSWQTSRQETWTQNPRMPSLTYSRNWWARARPF